MKNPVPRISDTEWEILRVIWAAHPATTGEITERLAQSDPSWHPKTVRTLLCSQMTWPFVLTRPGSVMDR